MKQALLSIPYLYNIFQSFVGKFGLTRSYLFSSYLPYCPGVKVLDLGCGPGTCTKLFKPEDYLGIDIDSAYVEFATNKYPGYQFLLCDFTAETLCSTHQNSFDLVFAYGLFHHLDDHTAAKFFKNAYSVLKPGGRMICFDGCIYDGQSKLSRKITLSDRGQYIRYPHELEALASQAYFQACSTVEPSAYSIPYSLMVLSLLKPQSP